jgi:hypothetical protein
MLEPGGSASAAFEHIAEDPAKEGAWGSVVPSRRSEEGHGMSYRL